jgi:hypothetical protein
MRTERGISLRVLGTEVHVSADLIAKIEKAHRRPTADVIGRCDAALQSGGLLTRLYALATAMSLPNRADVREPEAVLTARPPILVILPEDLEGMQRVGVARRRSGRQADSNGPLATGAVIDIGVERVRRSIRATRGSGA